jgi:hypothetical protein
MLYDKLWEIAHADWPRMTVEHAALVIGALVVAAVMMRRMTRISKRMRAIETHLGQMQKEIAAAMQIQVALMTKLSAKPKVEIDPRNAVAAVGNGDFRGLTVSPPTTPAQSESTDPAKLPG